MEFPKGYRFDSEFDLFCKVVDTAEKLIQSKSLFLLFGFEENVKFFRNCTNEEFEEFSVNSVNVEDFDYILDHEIIHLMNSLLLSDNNLEKECDGLESYLMNEKVNPEDAKAITDIFVKKMEYTKAHLLSESNIRRSHFKIITTNKKVQQFDWDICRYIFKDNQEQSYVQIKFSLLDDLPDIGARPQEKPERVQFVCDKHDIDYLIEKLNRIRSRLE